MRVKPPPSAIMTRLILTEMVEMQDAIKYFQSADYCIRFAQAGHGSHPIAASISTRHGHLSICDGWLERIDRTFRNNWEAEIPAPRPRHDEMTARFNLIPAGQVMAPGSAQDRIHNPTASKVLSNRQDLSQDDIHLNDLGAYITARPHSL